MPRNDPSAQGQYARERKRSWPGLDARQAPRSTTEVAMEIRTVSARRRTALGSKAMRKAGVDRVDDMTDDQITKCIAYMHKRIEVTA